MLVKDRGIKIGEELIVQGSNSLGEIVFGDNEPEIQPRSALRDHADIFVM